MGEELTDDYDKDELRDKLDVTQGKIERLEQSEKNRIETTLNNVVVLLSSADTVPDPSPFFSVAQKHIDSLDLQNVLPPDLKADNRQGLFANARATHGSVNAFSINTINNTFNGK